VACCWSEPGSITLDSPLSVYCYAWDGFVHTQKICDTTRLLRPARSTYCRYTDKLVLRFDHFCPWIKNAVGENNYRYFLFFLFMHWLTLGYASWGCAWMLLHRLEEERFWSRTDGLAQIYDPVSGEPRNISWGEVFRVALMLENKVTLLAMFCFFLAIVVFAFWAYHIWLTATNMTTNEAIKRGRVRARIQSAYEDEDEMVLDELKAMAGIDSSDEEPVADASTTKKRPGKGEIGRAHV
jgi:palmitoyltransferase